MPDAQPASPNSRDYLSKTFPPLVFAEIGPPDVDPRTIRARQKAAEQKVYAGILRACERTIARAGLEIQMLLTAEDLAHDSIIRAAETFDPQAGTPLGAYATNPINIIRTVEDLFYRRGATKRRQCRHCGHRSGDCACGYRKPVNRFVSPEILAADEDIDIDVVAGINDLPNPAGDTHRNPSLDSARQRLAAWVRSLSLLDAMIWESLIGRKRQMPALARLTGLSHPDLLQRGTDLITRAARVLRISPATLQQRISNLNNRKKTTTGGRTKDVPAIVQLGNCPARRRLLATALVGETMDRASARAELQAIYRMTAWTRQGERIL